MLTEGQRTNYTCEEVNNAFKKLVSHADPIILKATDVLHKRHTLVPTALVHDCHRNPQTNCERQNTFTLETKLHIPEVLQYVTEFIRQR